MKIRFTPGTISLPEVPVESTEPGAVCKDCTTKAGCPHLADKPTSCTFKNKLKIFK